MFRFEYVAIQDLQEKGLLGQGALTVWRGTAERGSSCEFGASEERQREEGGRRRKGQS